MAGEKQIVVGLMSGTSMDGVDAALVETDGEGATRLLAAAARPYSEAERDALRAAMERARQLARPGPDAQIDAVARRITLAHAEAVKKLPGWHQATLIGFHGQTVAHRPPSSGAANPFTWQIGDPVLLAARTGLPVVSDFRSADVAAGGEGAPLAPGFHRALASALPKPLVILNLGGVANITWLGDDAWGACDTGPANALVDDWVQAHGAGDCDLGGRLAATGRVAGDVLAAMLEAGPAPGARSFDRGDFTLAPVAPLTLADGAATLSAFTAERVARALRQLPVAPRRVLVGGGGRHNATMMEMLRARCRIPVEPVEAVGWDGDMLEAEAFAWLAVRSVRGLPLSWPETTGVPHPVTGGRLTLPEGVTPAG